MGIVKTFGVVCKLIFPINEAEMERNNGKISTSGLIFSVYFFKTAGFLSKNRFLGAPMPAENRCSVKIGTKSELSL